MNARTNEEKAREARLRWRAAQHGFILAKAYGVNVYFLYRVTGEAKIARIHRGLDEVEEALPRMAANS